MFQAKAIQSAAFTISIAALGGSALLLSPLSAQSTATDLTDYVGKYAFDEVAGTKFLDHTAVRAAVASDPPTGWGERLLGDGVTGPIKEHEGMVLYTACQPRQCDTRNWAIAMKSDGSESSVCVFDKDNPSRNGWYSDGEMVITVTGSCPTARQPAIAAKVVIHVTGTDPWAVYPEG